MTPDKPPMYWQADPSRQRWLEAGEVLRRSRWNPQTRSVEILETYVVPGTLREKPI